MITTTTDLEEEIKLLKLKIEKLELENQQLSEENARQRETIRKAKDISPVAKPSLKRCLRLTREACLNIEKSPKGWILSMGKNLKRIFKNLKEIWELLIQDDWKLNDIFNIKTENEIIPFSTSSYYQPHQKPKLKPRQNPFYATNSS